MIENTRLLTDFVSTFPDFSPIFGGPKSAELLCLGGEFEMVPNPRLYHQW